MKKRVLFLVVALMSIFTLTSCAKKFTVTFDSDGGTPVQSVTVKKGKTVSVPTQPTKDGSEFKGWTLDGTDYNFNTKVTKDITLKAKWELTEVVITFDTKGGNPISPVKIKKGGTINVDAYVPTLDGYVFDCWKLGTKKVTSKTVFNDNATLVAEWKTDQKTVTFNPNGGVFEAGVNTTVLVNNGLTLESSQLPKDPTNTGFDFAGWFLGDKEFDFNTPITDDITLVAKWDTKAGYEYVTITFNTDGGSEILTTQVVKGSVFNPSAYTTTKTGFDFVGWELNGELIDSNTKITEDVTLKAVWEEAKVTITFVTGKGTAIAPVRVKQGSNFNPSLYVTTNGDQEFLGWYLEPSFNTLVDENYVLNEDLTVYASFNIVYTPKWVPGQQVNGWQGRGMEVKIMVLPSSSYDPFNTLYNSSDKKIRQLQESAVETAYDIYISYVEWGDSAAWGPDRIQYIKDNANGGFRDNDVYFINITAAWIPTLVKNDCLAELYNMSGRNGIFSEIGYRETEEGSGEYVPAPYEQSKTNNQAASNDNKVYGYVTGKARPDYFMYYNLDLIKESGLEDPAELWFKGQWTWTNFEDYVKKLQTALASKAVGDTKYYALALGYPELFIGSCGSTGNAITNVSPARLYLNQTKVVNQVNTLQALVNSGAYDNSRGTHDVAPSFAQGFSVFHHGDLWFLNDPSRFDSTWPFEIGCVPYPAADNNGGQPITTDDPEEAIITSDGEFLTTESGEYISGVDMSSSSFKVPFTTTSCYSIVDTPAGKNGINNKVLFAIIYDLFDGQGDDPNAPKVDADEAYRQWLIQKKFHNEIHADVIMSVQDCTYFELIEVVSMSVGGGSQFGPDTLWLTIPGILKDPQKSVQSELDSLYPKYRKTMIEMGYMVP